MAEEELKPVRMIATCRTPGCPVEPFHGTYYPNSEPPIYRGHCIQCDQPITDLVPAEEALPGA